MMKQYTVIIAREETVLESWGRDASTFVLFLALIGIGVLLKSSAMQWAGFFVAMVVVLKLSSGYGRERTFTIEDAPAEIEREITWTPPD